MSAGTRGRTACHDKHQGYHKRGRRRHSHHIVHDYERERVYEEAFCRSLVALLVDIILSSYGQHACNNSIVTLGGGALCPCSGT